MKETRLSGKQRWVVDCDAKTIASIKVLAASKRQSMGLTLDQAVEYFCRKVVLSKDEPLKWALPGDW
jgi:antitoxin component of RelBE/YafQ-DinJ toxin-antitoxin module